jgi:hypothetical protein
MKACGTRTRPLVSQFLDSLKILTGSPVVVLKSGLMPATISETFPTVSSKAMVFIFGLMPLVTPVSGSPMKCLDEANFNGLMGALLKANLSLVSCKASECILGKTDEDMRETIYSIRSMARESTPTAMVQNTTVNGLTDSSMVWVRL